MLKRFTQLITLALVACQGVVLADTPATIMQRVLETRSERLEGVNTVAIRKAVLGIRQVEYFAAHPVALSDGGTLNTLRALTPGEVRAHMTSGSQQAEVNPVQLSSAAQLIRLQSAQVDGKLEQEMRKANMPAPLQSMLLNPPADKPWLSPNPADMMHLYANMLDAGARGLAEQARAESRSRAQADSVAAELQQIAHASRLVGLEQVDGRAAYHLKATGLNRVQQVDGQTFRLHSVSLWIDAEHSVPLRMRFNGVAEQGDQRRELIIERVDQDYRQVAGSRLYEPYRQVMRLQGVMTAAQREEMAEASAELAKARQQIAALPASQRRLIMDRMGPQMAQLESMAAGNGIEIVTQVEEIRVNAPLSPIAQSSPAANVLPVKPVSSTPQTAAPVSNRQPDLPKAQRCLERKAAEAANTQRKRRGFGRLLQAVDRVAARVGKVDVRRIVHDAFQVDATADDLQNAARDLGLTPDAVAACRQP
ncbi:MAG: hypothetical protein RIC89_10905 [Pseudomonadales bacterium]